MNDAISQAARILRDKRTYVVDQCAYTTLKHAEEYLWRLVGEISHVHYCPNCHEAWLHYGRECTEAYGFECDICFDHFVRIAGIPIRNAEHQRIRFNSRDGHLLPAETR